MFERFTDRARRVVVHAQQEARDLSHNYIGTEHLLLGLLREQESVAARALAELEIGLDAVRDQVIEMIGRGKQAPSGHIPFTPRAKKVLEYSLRESLQLSHNYIGTEHILLGLVREGEGVAAQVLVKLGGTLSRVRDKVIELVPAGTGTAESHEFSAELRRAGASFQFQAVLRRLETIDERLRAIERHLSLGGEAGPTAGPGERTPPGGGHGPGSGQGPGGTAEPGSTEKPGRAGELGGTGEPGAGEEPGAAG
jgi:ATP-dependent Clp protease ATP-binding subunit ClpA